jgi:putative phosphoribosyl transferase
MAFLDRRDAGRRLAEQLTALACEHPVVIALAPGGVPVGFEVAQRLRAPLDLLAVSKLGAPGRSEFEVGAIAEDGAVALDPHARRVGMTEDVFDATFARELPELRRTAARYRGGRRPVDVRRRTTIVVDDGVDTGWAELAAVRTLRARGAARIVVAAPVGANEWLATLGREADEVVCRTRTREHLQARRFYEDFSPVSDAEVQALLEVAAAARTPTPGQMPPPEHIAPVDRPIAHQLQLDIGGVTLAGELARPKATRGLVIVADGDGLSRLSLRNRNITEPLHQAVFATLVIDLLSAEEQRRRRQAELEVPMLARRLREVTRWAVAESGMRELPIGYFGASTGAAVALHTAAAADDAVHVVVSLDGRPDLAADCLAHVTAATLLLVGGRDPEARERTRHAADLLRCPHRVMVVGGAGRLFSEPGTLETAGRLAAEWFEEHLPVAPTASPPRRVAGLLMQVSRPRP